VLVFEAVSMACPSNRQLPDLPGDTDGSIQTGSVYLPGFGGEHGSNSNSEFVRFADGKLICSA
jgi:hypothetical protein